MLDHSATTSTNIAAVEHCQSATAHTDPSIVEGVSSRILVKPSSGNFRVDPSHPQATLLLNDFSPHGAGLAAVPPMHPQPSAEYQNLTAKLIQQQRREDQGSGDGTSTGPEDFNPERTAASLDGNSSLVSSAMSLMSGLSRILKDTTSSATPPVSNGQPRSAKQWHQHWADEETDSNREFYASPPTSSTSVRNSSPRPATPGKSRERFYVSGPATPATPASPTGSFVWTDSYPKTCFQVGVHQQSPPSGSQPGDQWKRPAEEPSGNDEMCASSPRLGDQGASLQAGYSKPLVYSDLTAPGVDAFGGLHRGGGASPSSGYPTTDATSFRMMRPPGVGPSGASGSKQQHPPGAGMMSQQYHPILMGSMRMTSASPSGSGGAASLPAAPLRPPHPCFVDPTMDDRCEICWEGPTTASEKGPSSLLGGSMTNSRMVRCQGCNLLVHQACYGVCSSQQEPWYCNLCSYWQCMPLGDPQRSVASASNALSVLQQEITCGLCNRPKGALKYGSEGVWVHVGCVLYSYDGPAFKDCVNRSLPVNIRKSLADHNRQRHSCSICRKAEGYTTKCLFPGCPTRLHVSCAFEKGLKPNLQMVSVSIPNFVTPYHGAENPGGPSSAVKNDGILTSDHHHLGGDPSGGSSSEFHVVEKLLKIVTCEMHSSENSHNAIKTYEIKRLGKAEQRQNASLLHPHFSSLPHPMAPDLLAYHQAQGTNGSQVNTAGGGGGAPSSLHMSQSSNPQASSTSGYQPVTMVDQSGNVGVLPQHPYDMASGYWQQAQPGAFPYYQYGHPGHMGGPMFNAWMGAYGNPSGPGAASAYPMHYARVAAAQSQGSGYGQATAAFGMSPATFVNPWVSSPYVNTGGMQPARMQAMGAAGFNARGVAGGPRSRAGVNTSTHPQFGGTAPGHLSKSKKEGFAGGPPGGLHAEGKPPFGASSGASPARRRGKAKVKAEIAGDLPSSTAILQSGGSPLAGTSLLHQKAEDGLGTEVPTAGRSAGKASAVSQPKKKKSGRGLGTTLLTSSLNKSAPAGGSVSSARTARSAGRKVGDAEEFGGEGASNVPARGYKVNWGKVDPYVKPTLVSDGGLEAGMGDDPVVRFLVCTEKEISELNDGILLWNWVLAGSGSQAGPTGQSLLNKARAAQQALLAPSEVAEEASSRLKKFWLAQVRAETYPLATDSLTAQGQVVRVIYPVSALLTVTTLRKASATAPSTSYYWTFWRLNVLKPHLQRVLRKHSCSVETLPAIASVLSPPIQIRGKLRQGALEESDQRQLSEEDLRTTSMLLAFQELETERAQALDSDQGVLLSVKDLLASVRPGLQGSSAKGQVGSFHPASSYFRELVERSLKGVDEPTKFAFFRSQSGSTQPGASQEQEQLGGAAGSQGLRQPGQKLSIDLSNWAEISRIEAVLGRKKTGNPGSSAVSGIASGGLPPFFILLKRVPAEILAASKYGALSSSSWTVGNAASTTVAANALTKYLNNKDCVSLTLEPALLRKTASTSKKMFLHGYLWDLNPPIPQSERRMRSYLPASSYAVSSTTQPSQGVPIADELTREWLTAAQRMRTRRHNNFAEGPSHSAINEDAAKAVRGEELVEILASEEYWKRLLFEDDFVQRQAVSHLMVWAKRRSKLKQALGKVRKILSTPILKHYAAASGVISSEIASYGAAANRWAALRAAFQAGHQDPSQTLVTRVEENETRSSVAVRSAETVPAVASSATPSAPNPAGASAVTRIYFCLVCFGTELDNLNPLVACHKCGVRVHKNCYAIGSVAQLDFENFEWNCDRCDTLRCGTPLNAGSQQSLSAPSCCVCTQTGGALKRMENREAFVHVMCAIWSFPSIICKDLDLLTKWSVAECPQSPSTSDDAVCVVCADGGGGANAQVPQCPSMTRNSRRSFGGVTPRRSSAKVIFTEEDDDDDEDWNATPSQIPLANSTLLPEDICDYDDKPLSEKPAPDPRLLFGPRGRLVSCTSPECQVKFHPLCGWLAGYKVVTEVDYARNVLTGTSSPDCKNLFFPALKLCCFCETHTIQHAPTYRLPIDVISQHRVRAYKGSGSGNDPSLQMIQRRSVHPSKERTRKASLAAETGKLPAGIEASCQSGKKEGSSDVVEKASRELKKETTDIPLGQKGGKALASEDPPDDRKVRTGSERRLSHVSLESEDLLLTKRPVLGEGEDFPKGETVDASGENLKLVMMKEIAEEEDEDPEIEIKMEEEGRAGRAEVVLEKEFDCLEADAGQSIEDDQQQQGGVIEEGEQLSEDQAPSDDNQFLSESGDKKVADDHQNPPAPKSLPESDTSGQSSGLVVPEETRCTQSLPYRDQYGEELCQSCFFSIKNAPGLGCSKCKEVWVHPDNETCRAGVLAPAKSGDQLWCTRCRLENESDPSCLVCPRMGGALVECDGGLLHWHCREALQGNFLTDQEASPAETCTICEHGGGILWKCLHCAKHFHPICRALHMKSEVTRSPVKAGTNRGPPVKRRKVSADTGKSHQSMAFRGSENCTKATSLCPAHSVLGAGGMQHLLRAKTLLENELLSRVLPAVRSATLSQKEVLDSTSTAFGLRPIDLSYGLSFEHRTRILDFLNKSSPSGEQRSQDQAQLSPATQVVDAVSPSSETGLDSSSRPFFPKKPDGRRKRKRAALIAAESDSEESLNRKSSQRIDEKVSVGPSQVEKNVEPALAPPNKANRGVGRPKIVGNGSGARLKKSRVESTSGPHSPEVNSRTGKSSSAEEIGTDLATPAHHSHKPVRNEKGQFVKARYATRANSGRSLQKKTS